MYPLRQHLKKLLTIHNINETQLAKAINLPQSVINRILSGKTPSPALTTLLPIARYFAISLDDLIGYDPTPDHMSHHPSNHTITEQSSCEQSRSIPLLNIDALTDWCTFKLAQKNCQDYVHCQASMGSRSFAFHCPDTTMEPCFPKGSLILADPQMPSDDQDFVVACLSKTKQITCKQWIKDGDMTYLKPINSDFQTNLMQKDDKILAKIVMVQIYPHLMGKKYHQT
jgi:SOS-response transcriptional repressor LexA